MAVGEIEGGDRLVRFGDVVVAVFGVEGGVWGGLGADEGVFGLWREVVGTAIEGEDF